MPRVLQINSNDNLEFTELVWDDDEENVDHPLAKVVELDSVDGVEQPPARRNPTWLNATVTELGISSVRDRWEEEVKVTIVNPEENLQRGTYTFLFRATDGEDITDRTVTLKVT